MNNFRILHFSDIHIGIFPHLRDFRLNKSIVGIFNHAVNRKRKQHMDAIPKLAERLKTLKPDFIICTGDLTSVGRSNEFQAAEKALEPFLEYQPSDFLYVPGNHDRYTSNQKSNDSLRETFQALNKKRWTLVELPILHSTPVADFILLNTAFQRRWFFSNGYILKHAWKKLDELLSLPNPTKKPRIILSHFPLLDDKKKPLPYCRQLLDYKRLAQYGEEGAYQLLLCGHIHHPFINHYPAYTECCAGSLTISQQYTVIDFDAKTNSFNYKTSFV